MIVTRSWLQLGLLKCDLTPQGITDAWKQFSPLPPHLAHSIERRVYPAMSRVLHATWKVKAILA